MTLPHYPSYKDSGVEWLGEVPGHWEVCALKSVATHKDDALDEATAPDSEIAYVDISNADPIEGITAEETILFSVPPSRARRRVKHGDVIVSTVRTYLRSIAKVRTPEKNLVVSTGFAVIRPGIKLAPEFLRYIVLASYFVDEVIARSTGVSYPAINASELVRIPVAVPPVSEQTQIATFPDRETAKIDALVAEQQRLMALLPFVRQFAHTDATWFAEQPWLQLQAWLTRFESSALFEGVMGKHAPWKTAACIGGKLTSSLLLI